MNNIIKIVILFSVLLTNTTALIAEEEATYTITGKKDPRLDARYLANYVSQSAADECVNTNSFTGGRRYKMRGRTIQVKDENYTIKFPITLTGENNDCNYEFRSLELIMKRKYDEELSSIHPILSDKKEVNIIYWKTKGGGRCHYNIQIPPLPRNHQTILPHSKREYFFV